MRTNDEVTAEYIEFLEAQLLMKEAECASLEKDLRAAKGQVQNLLVDRRYVVA